MLNKILALISVVLVTAILLYRFLDFFLELTPNKLQGKKFYKFFGLGLFAVGVFISIGHFLVDDPKSTELYYQNPDYWHPFLQYRNDQVTKIEDPFSRELVTIYGKWETIEEANYEIMKAPTSFEIGNLNSILNYYNGSTLIIQVKNKITQKEDEIMISFNSDGRLVKIEYPDLLKTYNYDQEGKLNEYVFQGQRNERYSIVYDNKHDYTVLNLNPEGRVNYKEYFKHTKNGLLLTRNIEHQDFSFFSEFEYQDEIRITQTDQILSGEKAQYIYKHGKGLGLLHEERVVSRWDWPTINNKYTYDEYHNWVIKVSYQNDIPIELTLRKIVYENRIVSGDVDIQKIDINKLLYTSVN